MVIFDESGLRRSTFVGPYEDGTSMTLSCDAFGGSPPPKVTWSRNGRLVDETFTVLDNNTVRNELAFRHVDRSFLHNELTCSASNTELARPVSVTVHVDMNFAPATVDILGMAKEQRLVAGKTSKIVCRTTGSRYVLHVTTVNSSAKNTMLFPDF